MLKKEKYLYKLFFILIVFAIFIESSILVDAVTVKEVGDVTISKEILKQNNSYKLNHPIDQHTTKIGIDKFRWSSDIVNVVDDDNKLKSCDEAVKYITDDKSLFIKIGKSNINISFNYETQSKKMVALSDINFSLKRENCNMYFTHNSDSKEIINLTYTIPQGAEYKNGKIVKDSIQIDLQQAETEQNIDIKQLDSKTIVFSGENITKLDPTVSFNGTNHSSLRIYWGDGCTTPQPITTYPLTCGTVTDISSSTAFDAINSGEFRYVENSVESNYVFADANVSFLVNGNYIINNFTWTVSGRSVSVGDNFKDNIYLYKYDTSTWEKRADIWNTSGAAYQEVILVNSSTSTYLGLENMTIFVGSNTTSFPSAAVDWIGLQIDYTADTPPDRPIISWINGSNRTLTNVGFNFTGFDNVNLSSWIFGTNQSGSWSNSSAKTNFVNYLNSSYIFNITTAKRGKNICTEVYYNDTSNQWNSSGYYCFDVANTPPTYNETALEYSISKGHNETFFIDVNGSDADGDFPLQFFINSTLFSIDINSGIITGNPSRTDEGNYSTQLNLSDGYSNNSLVISNNVTNSIPFISSVGITPSAPVNIDNLNCNYNGYSDPDLDAANKYFIKWYKNNVLQNLDNVSVLDAANTTDGEDWYCTVTPNDGTYNGTTLSSQVVNIGSGLVAPEITWINASSIDTGLNSTLSKPTFNNSNVLLRVNYTEANGDKATAYFCKSSNFTNNICIDGYWGISSPVNETDRILSTNFSVGNLSGQYYFYTFVLDNTSRVSSSVGGSFFVNNPPNMSSFNVTDRYYTSSGKASILLSSTDINANTYNFTVYNSSNGLTFVNAGSFTSTYNITSNVDTTVYFYVITVDQHNYNSSNSSIINVTFDTVSPDLTLSSPSGTINDRSFSVVWNYIETSDNMCSYNISLQSNSNNLQIDNTNVTCSSLSDDNTLSIDGNFNANFCIWDLAGNKDCLSNSFIVDTTQNPGGSGGGSSSGGDLPTLSVTGTQTNCSLSFNTNRLVFTQLDTVKLLKVKNNMNVSINPIYEFEPEYYELIGADSIILSGQEQEISVRRLFTQNESKTSFLVFSSDECSDVVTTIVYEGANKGITSWSNFLNNIEEKTFKLLFSKVDYGIKFRYWIIFALTIILSLVIVSFARNMPTLQKFLSAVFLIIIFNVFLANMVSFSDEVTFNKDSSISTKTVNYFTVHSEQYKSIFSYDLTSSSSFHIRVWMLIIPLALIVCFLTYLFVVRR